jgi:hypothetical protein
VFLDLLCLRFRVRAARFATIRLTLLVTGCALVAGALAAPAVRADAPSPAASWQFTSVAAPTPPYGTASGPYPVPLGQIGQISFWTPDRGLLITGGTENSATATGGVVPAGLYAYNGVDWHLLSTVCGGADGRIAWAGPDEFWTISDQRPGQVTGGTVPDLQSLSLCHFVDGTVVASYAMPLDQTDSYQQMDAAACTGPDDCWFGGQDTTSSDPGAFQLHWDGATLSELQEPEDHAIGDMTVDQGQIYESVRLQHGDTYLPSESTTDPAVLHRIGTDEDGPFYDVFTYDAGSGAILPEYGTGVAPDALEAFSLSNDGTTLGTGATQLWAAANPEPTTPAGSQPAALTILYHAAAGWSQLTPSTASGGVMTDPTCQPLDDGTLLADNDASPPINTEQTGTADGAIAAMPGTDDAWLSLQDLAAPTADNPSGGEPDVALIDDNGCVQELDSPESDGDFTQVTGESSAPGGTGPITCPADNDCWMATETGWLYHYTDGTVYGQDTDPSFAGVITVRPADAATPTVNPDIPPADDSGATQPTAPVNTQPVTTVTTKSKIVARLTKVTSKVLHHTTLVLNFHLNVRASVQIVASRKGTVVARSKKTVLAAGARSLTVTLNPKHWPTHIAVNAKAEPKP